MIAQTPQPFIEEIDWEDLDIPGNRTDLLDSILANPIYEEVIPVQIGFLPDIQSQGILTFTMPGRQDTFIVKANNVETYSDSVFTWHGKMQNAYGEVTVVSTDSSVIGQITTWDGTYEIFDFGGFNNVLLHFDTLAFSEDNCAVIDSASSIQQDENPLQFRSPGCNVVRVLILYTEAAARVTIPWQKAKLLIAQTNIALYNSDVSFEDLRLELAGIQLLEGFEETKTNIYGDLSNLRNNNTAQSIRSEPGIEADLVVLLTDGDYEDSQAFYYGLSYPYQVGDSDYAYAIVEADASSNLYTFSHEVGHMFGGRHEDDSSHQPLYARGYYFFSDGFLFFRGKRHQTMLCRAKKMRIQHFSNPDVLFDGEATGDETYFDMARRLREQSCTVSEYIETYNPSMIGWISGTHLGNENTNYTWCGEVYGCTTVKNYLWELSNDGFDYSTFADDEEADCITTTLPNDADLFIRLTLTCEDDQTNTAFWRVFNLDNPFCNPCVLSRPKDSEFPSNISNDILGFEAFPNPSIDHVNLVFEIMNPGMVHIFQYDLTGKSKLIESEYLEKGKYVYYVKTKEPDSGIHYFSVEMNGQALSKTIVNRK